MIDAGFQAMKGVSDLNGEERFWQSSYFSSGGRHEHRQNAVRSTHGPPGRLFIALSIVAAAIAT